MAARPDHDVVVVGGGAAGTAAALLLARARRRVALVDDASPRNAAAATATGIPWSSPIPPLELRRRALAGLRAIDGTSATIVEGRVSGLDPRGDSIRCELGDGSTFNARAAILATGVVDELPDIPGLAELWGTRVFGCPYCHGHEMRGKRLAVIGTGVDGAVLALHVARWSAPAPPPTLVLTTADALPDPACSALDRARITVARSSVEQVMSGGAPTLICRDGVEVVCDAIFLRTVQRPRSELARAAGCRVDDDGFVVVDPTSRTTRPPVYAAGDLVSKPMTLPTMQLVQAAADGVSAALSCDQDMFYLDAQLAGG